jgi:hypothetical protein
LKNIDLKFISIKIIVIALARTGIDEISKIEVIIIAQQNRFILIIFILNGFKYIIEIIKFIDLKIDDIPLICNEKIVKLMDILFCVIKGGYKVHPVLILLKIIILIIIIFNEGIKSQKLKLFIRGKIKSVLMIIIGIIQFLILPIIIGIVMKKIIIKA